MPNLNVIREAGFRLRNSSSNSVNPAHGLAALTSDVN
jgi:hypothetical protein